LKPIVFSQHAEIVAEERRLEREWIERAVRQPEWRSPDTDPTAERRFITLPQRDNRILRVACAETDTEIRVITVFLDRRAKRPV
jgi:hypothetical protein